jgi:hypothetical protein
MDSTQQELALLRAQKAYELTGASGSQAGSGYSPQL